MTAVSDARDGNPPSPLSALLTFVIADIRGYTRFTLEHGDEEAARLARVFAGVAGDSAAAYGGRIIELRGDEALAVFPSARQALRSALALQAQFSRAMAVDFVQPMAIGIGLDAGEAIPVDGGYRGAALNLAARLCALAGPGEVLASEAVAHIARKVEGVTYTARGEVQLKGFTDPVMVLEVTAVGMPAAPPATAATDTGGTIAAQELPFGQFLGSLPTSPLVAREAELRRVLTCIDAAMARDGRLVLLAGEPGAGKTRLAQEATVHLRDRGYLVAAGRCYEPEQNVPYYPFLDALAAIYTAAPASLQREISRRYPYLGVLLPDHLPPPASTEGGEQEEQRVLRAVMGFLAAVSAVRPLALLLDDLHLSDSASLKLLAHLARHAQGSPILLLATYRDVEVGKQHPLEGTLRDLGRDGLLERIPIRRLDVESTARLVATAIGEEMVSEEFAVLVHDRTDGNPYFVRQVLQVLVERGDVFRHDGKWDRRAIADIEVPESIRSVVGQRVSRLRKLTQEAIREASILGQTFTFDDLLAASDQEERELEVALEEAMGAGIVRDLGRDRYGFDHALTQQSIAAELSSRRRRRLHGMVGEALERLPEQVRRERVAEIAWHFREADELDRAIRYTLLAGDRAEAVFAHSEAERQYDAAATLARDLGDGTAEAEALERLGSVLEAQSLPDRELEVLEDAARLYRAVGDLAGEGRVTAGIGSALTHLGNPEGAIVRLERVRAALEADGPSEVLARLSLQLGAILYGSGRVEECLALVESARDMGRDIGNAAIVAAAENYRGDVVMQLGRYEDARQAFQANIPVAEASGDLGILAHTFHDLAGTCTMTGRFVEGENVARRALELQRSRDAPAMAAFALTVVGIAQFYQGRLGDARASMEEAVETLRTLPPTWHTPMGLAYLGMLERVEGRGAEADAHLNEAVAMGADGYLAAALAHQWLAEGDLLQGRAPAARARLEPFAAQTNLWALEMLPTLAWAMLESGDITAADALVTRLVADDRVQMPLRQVEALRVLGMVRRRQGRYDEASNVFGESVALARRMAYPFGEGRALCEWGRLAAERGDIPEARAHLTAAGEIFGRIGAQSERDRVRSILAAT